MYKGKKLTIGLDARFFGPQQTGLGRYTQKLIEHLEELDSPHQFLVFLKKENFDQYQVKNTNFKKVVADYAWYSLEEQAYFPKLLEESNLDLMHFFHFNVPLYYHQPYIVTIHDLILLNYPTRKASTLFPWQYAFKYAAYKHVIKQAVKNAKHIIAVSDYTKQQILSYFEKPENEISVTYEACEKEAQQLCLVKEDSILEKKKIQPGYLLSVGNAYPHKNLHALIQAYVYYQKHTENAKDLVIVGRRDYFSTQLEADLVKKYSSDVMSYIHFFGYASEEELKILYKYAGCYVFPSLEEGFGLPALEAMSHDIPVICSQASCLPEVVKRAALYVNPYNISEMAWGMEKITTSETLHVILKEKAEHLLETYSWKNCAKQTMNIYQKTHAY